MNTLALSIAFVAVFSTAVIYGTDLFCASSSDPPPAAPPTLR
jgi:hypothetical protein